MVKIGPVDPGVSDPAEIDTLRQKLTHWTKYAVQYGVDRDWANQWLARLGAEPVDAVAEYRLNIPVAGRYGKTVKAHSRAEAVEIFKKHVARVRNAGKIVDGSCDSVYDLTFGNSVDFYSGPQDLDTSAVDVVPDDDVKAAIYAMLKEGVSEQFWAYRYAQRALEDMGLPALPSQQYRRVTVPVAGTAEVDVAILEGDSDEVVARAAKRRLSPHAGQVLIKPEEVGEVTFPGVADMQLDLVDEDPF